jgi:molybdopterin molybdotransferase
MRKVVSFEEAVACVEAASPRLGTERVRLQEAMGRLLAEDIRAAAPIPPDDRAALDGFAVRADASLGASAYNPVELPLLVATTGAVLPPGADAVIPFDAVEADGLGHIRVVEPVAPGDNVERRGAVAETGAQLAAIGIRLALRHIGMLAAAEIDTVQVVRRPRVQILLAGPMATSQAPDSNAPMLRVAVERERRRRHGSHNAAAHAIFAQHDADRGEWGSGARNRRYGVWTRRSRCRGAR